MKRAFAHLHWFRRPRIRWEIRDDTHEAFLTLGRALIRWRRLNSAVSRQKSSTVWATSGRDGLVCSRVV